MTKMTKYFAQVIDQLAENGVLEVGQTVEDCVFDLSHLGDIAWECLESEPGLLSHVVTESCSEIAAEILG